ncbi:hypothetical protein [Synechococcus sp. CBW1107]|uniref:hypothetical protein n=1 Tax=Synechococcus sp. CBW1107 TaxID=2789857 RepID=UPI002AD4D9B4|nr:hypothetical protein [Synechococcus sp. CBW1107]CAK6695285.1 hypothetical protein ICNINCKA_01793 [Synechococcus sp. CBW1107]
MTTTTKPTITLPAGAYAIADPCHLLTESEWMEWDVLSRVNPGQQSFALSDGSRLVALHTERGDGWYFDQDNFTYCVDSGQIAIRSIAGVSAECMARLDNGYWDGDDQPVGRILVWGKPLSVAEEGSRLLIGDLVIETGWGQP